MPNLTGMSVGDAKQALTDAGFTGTPTVSSGDAGVGYDGSDTGWTVKSQTPKAGSQVPADTEVVIVVTQKEGGGNG
jgi:beta-lactam-binding protein with PASTA domain